MMNLVLALSTENASKCFSYFLLVTTSGLIAFFGTVAYFFDGCEKNIWLYAPLLLA